MTDRRARIAWWLPSKSWRNDGWRWRVASLVDELPGQCWANLVSWTLRSHEDDPDTPWSNLKRRVPLRRMDAVCRSDRDRNGCCYCGKLTTEFRAERAEFDAAQARLAADR